MKIFVEVAFYVCFAVFLAQVAGHSPSHNQGSWATATGASPIMPNVNHDD
jgi:hypothetical protein